MTHLNSSSTPCEASVLVGSAGTDAGTRDPGELLFGWRCANSHPRSSAGRGWPPGSPRAPRLQMSAASSREAEAPEFPPRSPRNAIFLEVSSLPINLFLPPVTRSRSAVHVTILFRQLSEPREPPGAPQECCLQSPLGAGDGGWRNPVSEPGLQ